MAVELGGGDAGDVRDVVGIRQRLARKGLAAENSPPASDQVEPGGADGDEGVLDAGVVGQPCPHGITAVAGQVVCNEIQVTFWIRLVECLQQVQVAPVLRADAVCVNTCLSCKHSAP